MADGGLSGSGPNRESPGDSGRREDVPRWKYRLNNLKRANSRLQEATARGIEDMSLLEQEGLIQRFEYTFELAWKTLKDVLEHDGVVFDIVTPRDVIRQSVAAGLLPDEEAWMAMLADRRRTSHEYDLQHLLEVIESICDWYAGALQELVTSLTEREFRES